MFLHQGYLLRDSVTPSCFLVLPPQLCIGSFVLSLPPLVHGFPYLDDALKIARPGRLISPFLIVRVFSSTLLPGFIGPESSVPPWICYPLPPPRFGISSSIRFSAISGNLRQQDRRASLGKTHHLLVSRPASCQFGSPDIRPRSVTPARPPLQHHLAGSLFATYTSPASCFLQTSHLW